MDGEQTFADALTVIAKRGSYDDGTGTRGVRPGAAEVQGGVMGLIAVVDGVIVGVMRAIVVSVGVIVGAHAWLRQAQIG